jgi:hypothetical protein
LAPREKLDEASAKPEAGPGQGVVVVRLAVLLREVVELADELPTAKEFLYVSNPSDMLQTSFVQLAHVTTEKPACATAALEKDFIKRRVLKTSLNEDVIIRTYVHMYVRTL